MPGTKGLSLRDRFFQYILIDESTGCHIFTGGKTRRGYGKFGGGGRGGKTWLAHRLSWKLSGRELNDSENLLHKCDNPPCCNPEHLFIGDQQDNASDMAKKGRGQRSKAGMPFGVWEDRQLSDGRRSFCSEIRFKGRKIRLGSYRTLEAAAAVAKSRKELLYGLRPDDSDYEGAEWGDYGSCVHAESRP